MKKLIDFGLNKATRARQIKPWVESNIVQHASRIVADIPVEICNELNRPGYHWAKRMRLKHEQWTGLRVTFAGVSPPPLPVTVVLWRLYAGAGKPWDSDGLPGGFKSMRDWLADWLIPGLPTGVADSDERITWRYGQERSDRCGVRVEVIPRSG